MGRALLILEEPAKNLNLENILGWDSIPANEILDKAPV